MGCGNSGMRDRFQEGMVPMRKFMGRMTITEDDLWPLFKQFDKCDGALNRQLDRAQQLSRSCYYTCYTVPTSDQVKYYTIRT